jgi:hypothetical protein
MKRNWSALLGTVLAFFVILWIHGGNTSGKFQNALLFSAYWIAPFLAVILIDWHYRKGSIDPKTLLRLMSFENLSPGWPALVALVVGFGAMVPFMNTGLLRGPAATALQGADLSFYVGFAVAGVVYFALRKRLSSVAFGSSSVSLSFSGCGRPVGANRCLVGGCQWCRLALRFYVAVPRQRPSRIAGQIYSGGPPGRAKAGRTFAGRGASRSGTPRPSK